MAATPEAPSHIGRLDVLRGVAILAVFLFHTYGAAFSADNLPWNGLWRNLTAAPGKSFYLLYPLSYGWAGVSLFFVISGFVIHLSTLRKPGAFRVGRFYWRRFWRIYPPYFVALVVFTLLNINDFMNPAGVKQVVTHLFMVYNFFPDTLFGINTAFWSLAVEMQFYLLYPLLLVLRRRWSLGVITFIALGVEVAGRIAGLLVYGPASFPATLHTFPLLMWFDWIVGAYVAEQFVQGKRAFRLPAPLIAVIVALFLATAFYRPLWFFAYPVGSFLFAVLVDFYLQAPRQAISLFERMLVPAGISSYSLYLYHQPLIWRFLPIALFAGIPQRPIYLFVFTLVFSFPLLFGLSRLSYEKIEKWGIAVGRTAPVFFWKARASQ